MLAYKSGICMPQGILEMSEQQHHKQSKVGERWLDEETLESEGTQGRNCDRDRERVQHRTFHIASAWGQQQEQASCVEILQVRHREVHLTNKIFTAKLSPTLERKWKSGLARP